MKKIIYGLWAAYSLNFVIGYAAVHFGNREKMKATCERLMEDTVKHPLPMLLVMPGENNGCLDFGVYPSTTGSQPAEKK